MKKGFGFALLIAMVFSAFNINAQSLEGDTIDYFNMSLEDLMNMEIVAVSKKAESSFDAPLSSSIITKEDIINSGATTIEEAFRLVPGFIVREESNGNYDIHIRGNDNIPPGNFTFFTENSMTLVMVDGRKVFNNMNGGTFWEALPVSITDVERMEIIRGASTALYGPNAVNGVVNIITKKADDRPVSIDGNLQYGNAGTKIGDVAVNNSFSNNKIKTRISANFEQRDRFTEDYYSWTTGEYGPYTDLIWYSDGTPITEGSPRFKDTQLSKDRYGANAWFNYEASKKVDFNVSAGFQNSTAQTVFMESNLTPHTTRTSESFYFNTISNIHGLNIQLTGNFGTQNIFSGSESSTYDYKTVDAIVEYDWTIGDITIRPGASYQRIAYDDTDYVADNSGAGYLNGESLLSNFAYYLRGDYQASEKIRLIAALRMDHYNKPDDAYFTYQLIGTYKPNDKNLLRASFAKANRGPVMVDFYTNYNEGSAADGQWIQYLGNDHLKLPTSHVIELGYRGQLSPKVQLDIETYYSITKNFPTFEPSVNDPLSDGYLHITYNYLNTDLQATQIGATASVFYAPSTKFQLKAFATAQKTELSDYMKKTKPMIIEPGMGIFENPEYKEVNEKHEQTPAFYGGLTANYHPIEKLNIFAGLNFYSKQTYTHDYAYSQFHYLSEQMNPNYTGSGTAEIKGNTTVNAKVTYKVYKNTSLFVNARNLFGSKERQFGFADETGGLYLLGININL